MVRSSTPKSALEEAIRIAGSANEISRRLRIPKTTISSWRKKGRCSPEKAIAIEDLTGVSRHRLRPDIFGDAPTDRALKMPGVDEEPLTIERVAVRAKAAKARKARRP